MNSARYPIGRKASGEEHFQQRGERAADLRHSSLVVAHRRPRIASRQAQGPTKLRSVQWTPEAPQVAQAPASVVHFVTGHLSAPEISLAEGLAIVAQQLGLRAFPAFAAPVECLLQVGNGPPQRFAQKGDKLRVGGFSFGNHNSLLSDVKGHRPGVVGGGTAAGFLIAGIHGDHVGLGPNVTLGGDFMRGSDSGPAVGGDTGGGFAGHPVGTGHVGHRVVLRLGWGVAPFDVHNLRPMPVSRQQLFTTNARKSCYNDKGNTGTGT